MMSLITDNITPMMFGTTDNITAVAVAASRTSDHPREDPLHHPREDPLHAGGKGNNDSTEGGGVLLVVVRGPVLPYTER